VPGVQVDGNDVFAVDDATRALIPEVKTKGPRFLHAVTYRFKGHVSVDAAAYRDAGEVSRALENDPLALAAARVPDAKKIMREAEDEVRRAVAAASSAPWPEPRDAYGDIQDTGSGQWR
jgi:pyruvate dehydrogenase E1 component alpha subunit